jgi:hypothetical protein
MSLNHMLVCCGISTEKHRLWGLKKGFLSQVCKAIRACWLRLTSVLMLIYSGAHSCALQVDRLKGLVSSAVGPSTASVRQQALRQVCVAMAGANTGSQQVQPSLVSAMLRAAAGEVRQPCTDKGTLSELS